MNGPRVLLEAAADSVEGVADDGLLALAEQVREAHQAATENLREAVRHAVAAGELLLEAKRRLRHGQWSGWVEQHCKFSLRTAQVYTQLARELPKLGSAKAQHVAHLSLRDAIAAVARDTSMAARLPAPVVKKALEEAEPGQFRTVLSRAVNHERYLAHRQKESDEGSSEWIEGTFPVPLPPKELVVALLRLCHEHACRDPSLSPVVVCEALNEAYCHIQEHGLEPVSQVLPTSGEAGE